MQEHRRLHSLHVRPDVLPADEGPDLLQRADRIVASLTCAWCTSCAAIRTGSLFVFCRLRKDIALGSPRVPQLDVVCINVSTRHIPALSSGYSLAVNDIGMDARILLGSHDLGAALPVDVVEHVAEKHGVLL